jgi:Na+-transporting methylmalonyl-CoA/oxaloacetate decarboxylase gamma subunit
MLTIIITFLSAISISVIAAGYSIVGLSTLFAGAVVPIIAMGSALEIGKLVATSWLYNNWRNKLVPKTIKVYLTFAVIVLIFITSMGIFGFLSKAHLDQVQPTSSNEIRIELIDKQITQQENIIDRAENTLNQLDKALDKYIDMEYVTRGLKEREKQKEEREALNSVINIAIDELSKLSLAKSALELKQDKIEAEVGPIKYIAELIYGENAKDHFDKAVRWVIIVLIFVFDPLAVLLLIAANISLRSRKVAKEENEAKVQKDYQKEATNAKTRAKRVRDREKVYKDILKKIGTGELKSKDYDKMKKLGLNPDEIRIKLNQIMDLS